MTASSSEPHVGLVVEGAGDRDTLPVVLRAHLAATGEFRDVLGKPASVHGRDKALAEGDSRATSEWQASDRAASASS